MDSSSSVEVDPRREEGGPDDSNEVGLAESFESVDSDGLIANRSKRNRRKSLVNSETGGEGLLEDDDFWNNDDWTSDNDGEWATDDEDKYKDIVDDDFDISEDDSLENLVNAGAEADINLLRESRGYRHKRKADLESQRRLLETLINSLNIRTAPLAEAEPPPQTKLLVASNFNMPRDYITSRKKPGKWINVIESAKDVRKKETPPVKTGTTTKKLTKKKVISFVQEEFMKQYELQVEQTRLEKEKRQKAAFWKEYTKGKEKDTGNKEHTALRSGPCEMLISWDGTRVIEYEDDLRMKSGMDSWKDFNKGESYERQMSFFIDVPKESKGTFEHKWPPVLVVKPPPFPEEPEVCAITGLQGRYKDPLTGLCYHDVDSFKKIRAQYALESRSCLG